MSQDVKIELNNLIKEIYSVFDIKSIYLFGSYAYGTANQIFNEGVKLYG